MGPFNIVLAEDDDGHAALVQLNLKRAGITHDVFRFPDGRKALEYVQSQVQSGSVEQKLLVLADIKMPGMDGIGLLKAIKSEVQTRHIPVVILTTTDDPRDVENCYRLGCSVYLVKPVDYDCLADMFVRLGSFLKVVELPRAICSGIHKAR